MADPVFRSAAGAGMLADLFTQQLAAWPIPYQSRRLASHHGETHVLVAGDEGAPALVLFHDWGESAAALHRHYDLERLAERFWLVMPDTVGQPGRSMPGRPANGDDYGEWAADLLDALGLAEVFVAGLAGGGELALRLAAFAPGRVIRGCVAAPGGLAKRASLQLWLTSLLLRLRPSGTTARFHVQALKAREKPLTPAHAHYTRQIALAATHALPYTPHPLTPDDLARIRAPIYLILGADDPTIHVQSAANRAQTHIPNVETEVIHDLAHLVSLDAPGLVEDRLLTFFSALG